MVFPFNRIWPAQGLGGISFSRRRPDDLPSVGGHDVHP